MKSIHRLALFLFALLTLPLAAQIPIDPVAWLKAEGNATDATAFANNGVVSGSAPYGSGKVGSAFSFTGNADDDADYDHDGFVNMTSQPPVLQGARDEVNLVWRPKKILSKPTVKLG